jgi:hypothetical protein
MEFGSRKPPLLDTWRRVAGELGGEVTLDKRGKAGRLLVPHGDWLVVTDIHTQSNGESSTTYTRVRALFHREVPFTLKAGKRNPLHRLGALFGYRSVPMNYSKLDQAFFVRSDRADLARGMLRGTALGQAMMRDPVRLLVAAPGRRTRKIAGDTVGEVQLLKTGKIRDVAQLRAMVQICMETLDQLVRLRAASADEVDVEPSG